MSTIARKAVSVVMALVLCLCAAPMTAYAAQDNTRQKSYTVCKGDSLWLIASRFCVGISELKQWNSQLSNPNLIYPGQVVAIPQSDSSVSSYEAEVVRLVNDIRRQYGLSPLEENWELSRVARYKSQNMHDLKYFSHTSPTYGSPYDMMKSFGLTYRTAGENIAMGYCTPQAVVNAWMNSPGHRANILNASYKKIGVGYVSDGCYCTQMFIG